MRSSEVRKRAAASSPFSAIHAAPPCLNIERYELGAELSSASAPNSSASSWRQFPKSDPSIRELAPRGCSSQVASGMSLAGASSLSRSSFSRHASFAFIAPKGTLAPNVHRSTPPCDDLLRSLMQDGLSNTSSHAISPSWRHQ